MAGKNTVGNLAVIISGNAAPYIQSLNQAKQVTGQFANQITNIHEKSGGGATAGAGGGLFQGMVGGFAAGAAISAFSMVKDGITSLTKSMIETAAQAELTQASFEVMVGSAEGGQKLLKDIQNLAVATPFDSAGLAENAKMMMGMGVETEAIIPALSRLGDIAAGDANKLQRLSLVLGQVMAAGKLQGGDLLQFTGAGVGVKDFAETMGVSVARFNELKEAGQVSSDVVVQTLNRLTSAGGRFAGMNDRMSKTVQGQWNALKESGTIALQEVGLQLFKTVGLADIIGGGADLLAPLKNVAAQLEGPLTHLRAIGADVFQFLKSGAITFGEAFGQAGGVLDEFVPTWGEIKDAAKLAIRTTILLLGSLADGIVKLGGLWGEYFMVPFAAVAAGFSDLTKKALYAGGALATALGKTDMAAGMFKAGDAIDPGALTDRLLRVKDKLIEAAAKTDIAGQWLEGFDRVESRTESFITRMARALEKVKIIPEKWVAPGDVTAFAKKIQDAMKEGTSPKAIFDEHIRLINQAALFGPENGGLNRKQVDFAFAKTVDDLEKAVSMGGQKFASSMLKGTQAAQSTINRAMFQRNANPQKRVENLLEQANRLAKLNEQHTKDTADAIRKLQIQGVGF